MRGLHVDGSSCAPTTKKNAKTVAKELTAVQLYAIFGSEIALSPAGTFSHIMGLFEYQKRITALEGRFDEAERHTRRLLRFVRYCPDKIRPEALRAQLDLVKALISLTKEESAFYAKLGRLYDFAKFYDDFMDILKRVDPDLTLDIIREIGERWTERMANQPDGLKK